VSTGVGVFLEGLRRGYGERYEDGTTGDGTADLEQAHDRAQALRGVALVAAGGFVGAGVVLLIWPEERQAISLRVEPSHATQLRLEGRF
jgi:hypothetical protein